MSLYLGEILEFKWSSATMENACAFPQRFEEVLGYVLLFLPTCRSFQITLFLVCSSRKTFWGVYFSRQLMALVLFLDVFRLL